MLAGCVSPLPRPSGITTEAARLVDPFSSVHVDSGLSASVDTGKVQSVVVIGDQNLVPLVEANMIDGVLTITLPDEYQAATGDPLHVRIVAAQPLVGLSTAGGARLVAQGLSADALALEATGGSRLVAAGTARRVNVDLNGAARVETIELFARDVSVAASGASRADVCAEESLDLRLSGASQARYSCAPLSISSDLSGGSTIAPI
jgi:hypothetical protein